MYFIKRLFIYLYPHFQAKQVIRTCFCISCFVYMFKALIFGFFAFCTCFKQVTSKTQYSFGNSNNSDSDRKGMLAEYTKVWILIYALITENYRLLWCRCTVKHLGTGDIYWRAKEMPQLSFMLYISNTFTDTWTKIMKMTILRWS